MSGLSGIAKCASGVYKILQNLSYFMSYILMIAEDPIKDWQSFSDLGA